MFSRLCAVTRPRLLALAALLLAGSSVSPTAFAFDKKHTDDDRYEARGSYSLGFGKGFRTGFRDGRSDARRGLRSQRNRATRRQYGDVTPYGAGFERGYGRGYHAGFASVRRGHRDHDRDDDEGDRQARDNTADEDQ